MRDVASDEWQPELFLMKVLELAERNALQATFPGVPIKYCFFHLMQSVYRWARSNGMDVSDRQYVVIFVLVKNQQTVLHAFFYHF